jgi:hypothetical protein
MKPFSVTLRGFLYGVAFFLAPFADKMGNVLQADKWPSLQMVAYCSLIGTVQMVIGLRAFLDGSAERSRNELNTQFIPKP